MDSNAQEQLIPGDAKRENTAIMVKWIGIVFVLCLCGAVLWLCIYLKCNSYDIILVSLFLVFGAVVLLQFVMLWNYRNVKSFSSKDIRNADLVRIAKSKEIWRIASIFYTNMNYAFSSISIVSSFIVLYIASIGNITPSESERIVFYSIISLMFTILLLIIRPSVLSNTYRKAYMKMEEALLLYTNGINDQWSPNNPDNSPDFNPGVGKIVIETFVKCEGYIKDGFL